MVRLFDVQDCLKSSPTGHTTLLRRWINVIDVDSTSQQQRVPGGYIVSPPRKVIFDKHQWRSRDMSRNNFITKLL